MEKKLIVRLRRYDILCPDKKRVFAVFALDNSRYLDSARVENAIDNGAGMIGVSDIVSNDAAFIDYMHGISEMCTRCKIPLLVFGRLDCALALDASGIVTDRHGISTSACRQIGGSAILIGIDVDVNKMREPIDCSSADFVLFHDGTLSSTSVIDGVGQFSIPARTVTFIELSTAEKHEETLDDPRMAGIVVRLCDNNVGRIHDAQLLCERVSGNRDSGANAG